MKRKAIIILFLLIPAILLCGCGKTPPEVGVDEDYLSKSPEEKYEELLQEDTKYLKDTFGFSASDLEGIDVTKLVRDYQIREFDYTKEEVIRIITEYGDMYSLTPEDHIYRMFNVSGGKWHEGAKPVKIGYSESYGTAPPMQYVFDLENNVMYFMDATEHPLPQEKIDSLRSLPDACGMAEWEPWSSVEVEWTTDTYFWKIVVLDEDNNVALYAGVAPDMAYLPENVMKCVDGMLGDLMDIVF